MNRLFATAIGRALGQTRAGNPAEATRIIQAALEGAGGATPPSPEPEAHFDTGGNHGGTIADGKRRSLGRVIGSLVQGGSRAAPPAWSRRSRPSSQPAVPHGAQYLARRHASAFGSRDYRLFVPSVRAEDVQGLVVMLHGCTQSSDDFAAGTRMNDLAERHDLIVVYPQQDAQENPMACWNWFRPGDQRQGSGEPALLADLARSVAAEHGIGSGRVFVAGLSAGGAMAAILGQAYPEDFRAVGVHSGLAPGSASDVAGAYAAMLGQGTEQHSGVPVRTIVFQGTADRTVHPSNAESILRAALGNEVSVDIEDDRQRSAGSGGHGVRRVIHQGTDGRSLAESWTIGGAGHAWSGGAPEGSYTDPAGPDASAEMIRFFLEVAGEDNP